MKLKLLLVIALVTVAFQCTDSEPKSSQEFTGLSSEIKDRISTETSKAMAIVSASLKSKGKKAFSTKANLSEVLNSYRNTLNDRQKKIFDAIKNDPNVKAYVEWSTSNIKGMNSNERVATTFWNESQVLSSAEKTFLGTIQSEIDYYMSTSYGKTTVEMVNDISNTIAYYIDLVPYTSSLTSAEKEQMAASLQSGYESVPGVMMDLDDSYEDQRTAFNWPRFRAKVGSVLVHIVVGALVVVAAAAIIVATGGTGAAALLEAGTIYLGTLELDVAAIGLVYGAEAGAGIGVAAAFANQCLQIGNPSGIQYSSC